MPRRTRSDGWSSHAYRVIQPFATSSAYIAEGYKRNRNKVSVANSDPTVVVLCTRWIRRFARNPVSFSVQYHADQDLNELKEFWGRHLGVALDEIRLQRKSIAVSSVAATGDRNTGS